MEFEIYLRCSVIANDKNPTITFCDEVEQILREQYISRASLQNYIQTRYISSTTRIEIIVRI